MKPTFALDLSRDAIALLHRTPKGWLSIGEVAFDAPDMAEALDFLRKTALGLSPLGLACKIILPNNQVLYSEIHAPGPSREDKRRQIAQALQGRTPYAIEDLVFDWSGKGTVVRVAVVARETLDEAEAFAVSHRLNPVSFVTIPEDDTFIGEAWFGAASSADTILAPGETVERDRDAVSIITREVPPPASPAKSADDDALPGLEEALNAEVSEADLALAAAIAPKVATTEEFDPIDPFDELPLEPDPSLDIASTTTTIALPDDEPAVPETELPPSPELSPAPTDPVAELVNPTEAPAAETKPAEMPKAAVPTGAAEPEPPSEAPFTEVEDEDDGSDGKLPKPDRPEARVVAEDILDDDLPPAPSKAAMVAFSSRRLAGAGEKPDLPGRSPPPVTSASDPAKEKGVIPRPVPPVATLAPLDRGKLSHAAVTSPTIPGSYPKPRPRVESGNITRPVAPGPKTVKPSPIPNSPFSNPPAKPRRTGFILMVMVGLLLLGLALLAAGAQYFLTQASNEATVSGGVELVDIPAVEDEMAADMQDPEDLAATDIGETDPILTETEAEDLADLAVEELPVNIGGDETGPDPAVSVEDSLAEAPAETVDPGAPAVGTDAALAGAEDGSAEPAPGTTIATDVSSSRTPVEDQDEIFLAAMDAPPPILDALALPALAAVTDAPPDAPMPPPAFGTVYQFNDAGLLVPTPEGILSPDGIMLFAGPPPLVPPSRSALAETAAAAAAPAVAPVAASTDAPVTAADASLVTAEDGTVTAADPVAAAVEPTPADPAMAGFRPKPRPAGLVVPDDGASLDTNLDTGAATETASVRPLARPASVSVLASAANPDSAVADLGAQGASLAAQAEAQLAAAAALEAADPSIVAISMRPMARPSDLSRAVEDAVAAAVREPDPAAEIELAAAAPDASSEESAEIDEPEAEGAAPAIPTKASVAKQATYDNAINLSKTNLIGIFGTASNPYALVRQSNGKYKKVEVGDKIDGGVVKAITENELRYQKGGKLVTLKMPKA